MGEMRKRERRHGQHSNQVRAGSQQRQRPAKPISATGTWWITA